jgi:hypothetical protein
MFEWILDTLGRIEEAGNRLHVLSLFIAMAEDHRSYRQKQLKYCYSLRMLNGAPSN